MASKKRKLIWQKLDRNSRLAGLVLILSMLMVLIILGARFSKIAVTKEVKGHQLDKATQHIYRSQSIDEAKRGQIFDANGTPLAENTTAYTVVAILDDQQVDADGKKMYVEKSQDDQVSQKLAKELGGKPKTYKNALENGRKSGSKQVQFGSAGLHLNVIDYKRLKEQNIPGITFIDSAARFYPNGAMAANLIGFTNHKENEKTGLDEITGISGVEAGWNKELTGKDGIKTTAVDETNTNRVKAEPAQNGYDVYTTIDSKLQTTLELRMDKLNNKMKPESALAVVMDPKTGEIVATTQRPNFNASTGKGVGNYWQNELTSAFEPGSVMKGVSLAAGIDTDNWQANDTYQSGTLTIDGKKITDWNQGNGWGRITYNQGIALSSNVAMALTERKIGSKTWEKYIHDFGFLKSTKSGLLEENDGMMQFRYPFERANTAFGQAISTTPLQMLQAYTAIAGNGTMIKPNVVSKVIDPNTKKVVYDAKPEKVGKPISKKTAEATRKQLEAVVYDEKGLGKEYALPDVRTTGKSGTAQISTSEGYSTSFNASQEIHSWMGMAPAKNPRYMMYIVVKKPTKATGEITTEMANVFKPVMQQALSMAEGETESVSSAAQITKVPNVVNKKPKDAADQVKKAALEPVIMGDGDKITAQTPGKDIEILNSQRVFLNTGKNLEVPDMHGWSKNDVMKWAELAKIKINSNGDGFVAEQSVKGGTLLQTGVHEVTVTYKQPKVK